MQDQGQGQGKKLSAKELKSLIMSLQTELTTDEPEDEEKEEEKCCTTRWFWNNHLMKFESKALNHVRGAGCISEDCMLCLRFILGSLSILNFYFTFARRTAEGNPLYANAFTSIMLYSTGIYHVVAILAHAFHKIYGPKPRRVNGKWVYPDDVPLTCLSKTVQIMYMTVLPNNIIVTFLYWGVLFGGSGNIFSYTNHIMPMVSTGLEFFFNRIVFEHNLAMAPTALISFYGFCILLPYTLLNSPVYWMLNFSTVQSWFYAIGLVACAPAFFFVIYGL